jgi:hypothetical protein
MIKDKKTIKKWTIKDKLRYAWQMTKAVSDLHSVGNVHNSASISHTDIKSNQYLWINGMFKVSVINDQCNHLRKNRQFLLIAILFL